MCSRRVASDPTICVSGADAGISPRIGFVDDATHWIGSTGAPPGILRLTGLFLASRAESRAIRTGLCTDSSTVLSCSRHESAGSAVRVVYCSPVLRSSKEKRSMEPRQLRLPGFTFMCSCEERGPDVFVGMLPAFAGVLKSRRLRFRQHEPPRRVRQRVFVAVRAVEQKHALVAPHQSALLRLPPRREYGPALGAE